MNVKGKDFIKLSTLALTAGTIKWHYLSTLINEYYYKNNNNHSEYENQKK